MKPQFFPPTLRRIDQVVRREFLPPLLGFSLTLSSILFWPLYANPSASTKNTAATQNPISLNAPTLSAAKGCTAAGGLPGSGPSTTGETHWMEPNLYSGGAGSLWEISLPCHSGGPGQAGPFLTQLPSIESLSTLCNALELPPQCVAKSMEKASSAKQYRVCQGSQIKPQLALKPCQSDKYSSFVYLGFLDASRCLDLKPKEWFGLIHVESRFQASVESATGALGLGQLTPIAVADVNQRGSLTKLESRAACQPLKKVLSPPLDPQATCALVAPPAGPLRNFLYSGALYSHYKEIARKLTIDHSSLLLGMTGDQKKRVIQDLAQTMYNGGSTAISALFRVFAAEKTAHLKKVDLFKKGWNYSDFRSQWIQYIAKFYGTSSGAESKPASLARRKEVAGYLDRIQDQSASLEEETKVRCTQFSF